MARFISLTSIALSKKTRCSALLLPAVQAAPPKALLPPPAARRRARGQRARAPPALAAPRARNAAAAPINDMKRWEKADNSAWAALQEDAEGRLQARSAQQETKKRKRQQAPGGVARGLIRYVALVVDASEAAKEPDPRPSRLKTACDALATFCGDLLAANPLGACCVVAARDGGAKVASDPSSARRSARRCLDGYLEGAAQGAFVISRGVVARSGRLIERPGTRVGRSSSSRRTSRRATRRRV